EEFSITVDATDMHGIATVSIDLQSYGGDKMMLEFNGEIWSGRATMPMGVSPGKVAFPIVLEDSFGARTIHTGVLGDDVSFIVLNEPPMISASILIRADPQTTEGEYLDSVLLPISGDSIRHVMEVSVSDPDGVSVVQTKIGRLAPIGSSETWLNMNDDGINGDSVAGDGVYSLVFNARSSLEPGIMEIKIRATDIYQSMTPLEEQGHQITLVREESSDSASWLSSNTDILAVVAAAILTVGAFGAIIRVFTSDESIQ
ncbi:MAG: choice-of-anchor X domain-containing protein, partial [Candidatus Thermoplasmatota archaeon]|nr:choice-of-anchor X domain-containing protein [Candidatus Thermoplasmatota archaeon]